MSPSRRAPSALLRNPRNATTISAAVKLGIFSVASILVTGLLVAIMGNIGFGAGEEYKAVFSNASMLQEGDDVRIAGVNVGDVKSVDHYQRSNAVVTFQVKDDINLTTASHAEIRFLNLVGDRYMALERGSDSDAQPLEPNGTIPIENTSPALDLTVLFNGFQPLFQALRPDQVNELSLNLVQVLQGEGGTVASLMEKTASLTNTLADRDQLIGEVITNLTQTLDTVDQRREQLGQLITELKGWMTDLARDRSTIGASLDNVSELTVVVADLVRRSRPVVKDDIVQLRRLAGLLNRPENRAVLEQTLDRLPESMTDQTRTGTYGSWYSYYLCEFSGKIEPAEARGHPGHQAAHARAEQHPVPLDGRQVPVMRRYTEGQILRLGAITIVVMLLVMAASFNLSKFPGFSGDIYRAEFSDASGLRSGNVVQVGGIRVGRVEEVELDGAKVLVTFEIDKDVEFGTESQASIEVLNLLGEKFLELTPVGSGQLDEDDVIPVSRTESAYDIVGVFGDLATTTERIDTGQLKQALDVVSKTMNTSSPQVHATFEGISRLSQTVASRDAQIQSLLSSSRNVSALLADRSNDIVRLMDRSDLVFKELERRKAAIHRLLVNARILADELRGLARDNQAEIGPALQEVDDLLDMLIRKERQLKATLDAVGPYSAILGNIIGTGPWFDAYVFNLATIPTGEFQPGGLG